MASKGYIYDFEIYSNFVGVTFIPEDVDQRLIDGYVNVDIKRIKAEKDKDIAIDNFISWDKENKIIEQCNKDKEKLLKAIGAKQFIIWNDLNGKDFRNDLMLLQNFFISHKILTGYNSNDYDRIMLILLLYNAKYVTPEGYHYKEKMNITEFLFRHSQKCIDYKKGYYYTLGINRSFTIPFTDYDIQKILYLDKSFTSLKQVAITLKWYRIQDLPIHYLSTISKEDIPLIMDYNVNDDLITLTLKRSVKNEIELREDISNEFGINVRNMSRSSIGKSITIDLYSKFTGLDRKDFIDLRTDRRVIYCSDIIDNIIKFQTPFLHNLLQTIKKQRIVVGSNDKADKFEHKFRFGNNNYTMALGGLHSQDEPGILTAGKYIYRDADVASYYPNGIVKFKIAPEHLQTIPFISVVGYTAKTRVEAKHQAGKLNKDIKALKSLLLDGKLNQQEIDKVNSSIETLSAKAKSLKTKAEGLKIAINRMYGAFRDVNDFLYDPFCTYRTTINLQLCLLMLIEDLEIHGINIVSANTDGIVSQLTEDQNELYYTICDNWQKKLNFELEYTDYEKYLRNDVNNYIAIKKGFAESLDKLYNSEEYINGDNKYKQNSVKELEDIYIKRKGLFIEELAFNKGYNSPVVALALNQYLIYNIPYQDTIDNHIKSSKFAIYDYCISQKSDSKFTIYYDHVVDGKVVRDKLQKSNRFYISNTKTGTLIKHDNEAKNSNGNPRNKESRIVAKFSVEPFNNYYYMENYPLDYGYYKRECSKILDGKNKKTDGIIKTQEKLDLFSNENINLFEGEFIKEESITKITERREEDIKRSNIEFKVDNSFLDNSNIVKETPQPYSEDFGDEVNDLPF